MADGAAMIVAAFLWDAPEDRGLGTGVIGCCCQSPRNALETSNTLLPHLLRIANQAKRRSTKTHENETDHYLRAISC